MAFGDEQIGPRHVVLLAFAGVIVNPLDKLPKDEEDQTSHEDPEGNFDQGIILYIFAIFISEVEKQGISSDPYQIGHEVQPFSRGRRDLAVLLEEFGKDVDDDGQYDKNNYVDSVLLLLHKGSELVSGSLTGEIE